jgi:hypothetical protein
MKVSREDAIAALDQVQESRRRVGQRFNYRYSARLFFLWGSAWILANVLSDIMQVRAPLIWDATMTLASCLSIYWAFRRPRFIDAIGEATGPGRHYGRRYLAAAAIYLGFIAATFWVMRPFTPRQVTAVMVLAMAQIYLLTGVWRGARYLVPGAMLATLALLGYAGIIPGFELWIGIAGGTLLIGTGLWFRRI